MTFIYVFSTEGLICGLNKPMSNSLFLIQRVFSYYLYTKFYGRRRYNLSKDKKTLHMEWDARAPKPESATKMVNQKPTQKRLRSGNGDLIVVIGTGLDMKQFECDSMILALASSKLDARN